MSRFDRSTNALSIRLIHPIAVVFLLVSLHVSSLGAADTINIKDLKFNAVSLQLKVVTIRGTVKNLKALSPHPAKKCIVYGSYTFTLVDESGEVDVEKVGSCLSVHSTPPVNEGDAVSVHGLVQFFHTGNSGAEAPMVRLQLQEVVKIGL